MIGGYVCDMVEVPTCSVRRLCVQHCVEAASFVIPHFGAYY
jgi:hypothetical protein